MTGDFLAKAFRQMGLARLQKLKYVFPGGRGGLVAGGLVAGGLVAVGLSALKLAVVYEVVMNSLGDGADSFSAQGGSG